MKLQVQKWGNSLALRIPKSVAASSDIEQGTMVEVEVKGENIVLKPVRKKSYTLDEMLEGITKKNLHGEISTGKSQGREVW